MDAREIRQLEPMLKEYLEQFVDCFAQKRTWKHLCQYVRGQLSDLPRKSVEPIALAAQVPVRTLQEFLTLLHWREEWLRERLCQLVAKECDRRAGETVGIVDETSIVKKGDKTPGVQRQYLGCVGKIENGIVLVHFGVAVGKFQVLVDGDLYLPESWARDRERCRQAKIPEEVGYRPKTEIALALYDRVRANGLRLDWVTFDAGYGKDPGFLRAWEERQQLFVGEIPRDMVGWIVAGPEEEGRREWEEPQRSQAARVEELVENDPLLREQPWQTWRIKDTDKGPVVWKVKRAWIEMGSLPGRCYQLLVCEHPLRKERKYFLSNAPAEKGVGKLLHVGFSRWAIERCFQQQKGELGLSHWEGRSWVGLQRHLVITSVSHLFLALARERFGEKKSGTYPLPGAGGGQCGSAVVVA